MNTPPQITLVIPVFNRAERVAKTLDSLAAQTLRPAHIVLVDNNSADGSLQVLRQWAVGRREVEVISETAKGAAAARNAGLRRADTPYVMFFDSDDIMPPRHIEEITAALQANNLPDILEFPSRFVGITRKNAPLRKGDPLMNHIFHATLATQRWVARTDLVRAVGGWDESLLGWDDLELGVRLLVNAGSYAQARLSRPVEIITHAESITGADFSSKAGQWELALDCMEANLPGRYRRYVDYRRAILAGNYRREGHPKLARGLVRTPGMKLIARYVALGGRGVAVFANLEKFL